MIFSKKWRLLIILLVLLFSAGSAYAAEADNAFNETASYEVVDADDYQIESDGILQSNDADSIYAEESDEIVVEDWGELQYYSSLNDRNYVLKLKENTNYYPDNPMDESNQILFKNNVTIIGSQGAYIGDTSPDARNITYLAMSVPDDNGVGITFKNVTFKWIGTRYQPDGVFLQMGGNAINYFENCYFTNISVNLGHSSILHIKTGDAVVTNCTFINCTTDFGCLSVYNPNDDPTGTCTRARMNVTDSYFEGNYARTEPGCINNCGVLIVKNSTFYKNSAFWWAGAIHTHGGANTTIYDSDFIDNLAGWNGGALYTYSYLQIYNTRFIGNNCTTNNGGGAIGACKYLHAPYIYIENSLFEDNENLCWGLDELSTSGTGRGGAISFMDDGSLEVYNTTFIKNSASIGTAICAISGGLSYGSPDVRIVGNRFINHTRVGDVLDVRVATGSVAEIRDNYFENNSIVFSKLKLTADDPDPSGRVTLHIDAALKNPNSYDEDILDKSDYDVYVNGVYEKTVSSRTFTLDIERAKVYVIPCISNSKSNDVIAGNVKKYVYVSSEGMDTNDGLNRTTPVKTLQKAIEIANFTGYGNIVIMNGEFKNDNNLVIDFNLTITAENSASISSVRGNIFKIIDGDVEFHNVTFKNCQQYDSSSSKNRIIEQTNTGFLILNGCVFENNKYQRLIESEGQVEAENLRFTGNSAILIASDSVMIKSSNFTENIVNTNARFDTLLKYKSNTVKFEAEDLNFINNDVMKGCIDLKGPATISSCNFINNYMTATSSQRSSGIYIEKGSVLVQSCKFINTTDKGSSSAVIYNTGTVLVKDSIFINNSYENEKGIINGGTSGLKQITANNNWWGNTPDNLTKPPLHVFPPSNQLPNGWDPVKYWLILNATSLSNEIELDKEVPVQFMFTQIDNEGNVTNYDGVKLPSFELKLTAVNGTCSDSKITVENGMATTYFTLTQMSTSSLTGTFNGIDVTIRFQFKKSIPEMTIDAEDISVGDSADIVVNLETGATGSVILKVGNITQTETISNSKATFSIPGLPAGSYTIEANYTGNDRFKSKIETANLTVNKHNSTTSISAGSIELGNDAVFTITVSDGATGTFDIYVNGVKETTIDVGQTFTIHNISRGDYVVSAVYSGDSNYLASEDEYSFEVGKLVPSMTVTAHDIIYGDNTIVTVNLNSDATGNVTVTIDGKTNTSQLSNGAASIKISGINAGENKVINVDYSGDHNYKNATATKTYNVNKASLDFTINADNVKLGQAATVTIQLPARSGGTLTITGIRTETKNIPLTGRVILTYSDLDVGNYTVSAEYNGDNYMTVSKSITFEVSDWNIPQWPNGGYDVENTGKSPYSSEANGNVKWVKDISGTVIGNLAIDSDGRIYVVVNDTIYSINPDDGSTNWIFSSQDAGESFSGVAISRDTVLVPKAGDTLYFINQTTGEKYPNNMYQGSSAFAPVVDYNANIYISGEIYNHTNTNVVVIPYEIWQTSTAPAQIEIGDYEITSAPVLLNNNFIVITTTNRLILVDAVSNSISFNIPLVCDSNPVVGPGNIIYVISNGKVYSYNGAGTSLNNVTILGTAGNYLSVGENGEIFSINHEGKLFDYSTGEEELVYDFKEPISSRLLVGKDSTLYAGSETGMFYSIDTDGNLLWKVNLNQSVTGAPVMDKEGVIYVISANRLIAIDNAQLKDSNLTAEIKNVTYGENVTVDIELDEMATGIVSINIANRYVNESANTNGRISFIVPDLPAGKYTAKISYAGDSRFDSKEINIKFSVGKIDPAMNVDFHNINAGEVLQINVTDLPSDATGTVSVSVGDKSDSSNIQNGRATLIISGLAKGEYPFTVTYSGDGNYNGKTSDSKTVSVGYVQTSFNAASSDVNVGDVVEITVTGLPNDADGVSYVNYKGLTYRDSVINGNAKITIPDLTEGEYDFDVMYANSTKYSADPKRVHVAVSKVTPTFTVSVNNVSVGENIVVEVSGLPNDATGLVISSIADITRNASVGYGKATITIPQNLTAGTYTLNVSYDGDNKYNKINVSKTVKISKITPQFTIALADTINVWDDIVVDVSALPLDATGKIYASIDGISNSSDIENGLASVIIHQRLTNGTYPVEISYSGNYKYDSFNETRYVNINKVSSKMTVNVNDEINVGEDLVIEVSGIPMDTTENYVDVIGDIVAKGRINEGTSRIVISNLTSGKYSFAVDFRGDDKYDGFRSNQIVNVNKFTANMNVTADNINVGEDMVIRVELPGDISNENVYISINEEEYSVEIKDGVAVLSIHDLTKGTYPYSVAFYGNDKYLEASYENIVGVGKVSIDFNVNINNISYGKTAVVEVSNLPDDASGNVIVIVNNGQYVSAASNGVASVNIPNLYPGIYTAEIRYSDDKYMSNSKLLSFCISKIDPTCAISADDINVGDELQVNASLPDDATGYVTITVGNVSQKVKLNKGLASADFTALTAGGKTVNVDYEGDRIYESTSASKSVTVRKVVPAIEITADDIIYGESLIVRVNLPSDATGDVTVNVGGKSQSVKANRGVAIANITGLSTGNKSIDVTYKGDNKYNSVSTSKSVAVNKIAPEISIEADNIKYGESLNVKATLSENINGNVIVSVGDISKTVKAVNGVASTEIKGLTAGSHVVDVKFGGDSIYEPATASKTIAVSKATQNIVITADDIKYGEDLNIEVTLNDKVNVSVSISVSGILKTIPVKDGVVSIAIQDLNAGDKTIDVKFDGNENYYSATESKKVTVSKIKTPISVNAGDIEYGNELIVKVDLKGDATGKLLIHVGDMSQSANVTKGSAGAIFSGLAAGKYDVTVKYLGDVNYLESDNSTSINVFKIDVPVNETTIVKSNDSSSFTINLPSDAAGNVTLTINNETYTFPVVNGNAHVEIPELGDGKYPYTITYSGNDKYLPFSESGELIVKKDAVATVIVVVTKFSRYATDYYADERGQFFYAFLKDVNGNPLANKTVKIAVNGPIYNVTTDSEGKAGLQVNLAAANTYTYALLFSGDEEYKASLIASSKLTVVKKPTGIIANNMAFKTTAKTKTVVVALNTIKNPYDSKMYLKKGKTITLTVNGKVYTAKTDKDGIAKFNIKITKKGKYTATVKFAGDNTYEGTSKKITISISANPAKNKAISGVGVGMTPANIDTGGAMNIEGNYSEYLLNESVSTSSFNKNKKDVVIEVDPKFTRVANDFYVGERGDMFYATLKDSSGKPIAGKTVQIAVNGPIYKVVTDKNGKAGLQVNLAAANTYTYALSFSGDDEYNAAQLASSKLTVTKKATSITAANKQFKKSAKTKSVSVTLKTSKNPYDKKTYLKAGKQITLKVNGKTYTAKTGKNGVAKFNIKLTKKGKYTAKISFAGDKTYGGCNKSISITIK